MDRKKKTPLHERTHKSMITTSTSFIDQACSVKMTRYWTGSFLTSLRTSTPSRSIKIRTWLIEFAQVRCYEKLLRDLEDSRIC